jgi:myo-inositol-1(or 4)-monophosphatase
LDTRNFLEVARQAAREAGDVLVQMQQEIRAEEKGPKDLVTQADLAAQRVIESRLHQAFPDHEFLGEESPEAEALGRQGAEGYRWIVDPLDGTVNYAHGLPSYAVSIGLEQAGKLICGVVLDPVLNELFHAVRGEGAFLNGKPIRPSSCVEVRRALIAASLPANVARDSVDVAWFVEFLHHTRALRRLGSAALNLCYVACGRLDGYWARTVKPWDVAAAALCCQEAGGVLTGLDGRPFQLTHPHLLSAGTTELQQRLQAILDQVARTGPALDDRLS